LGIVILLILAGIWVGVGVVYFRGRLESTPADSIGDFRRQLRVLQRTGPSRGMSAENLDFGRHPEAVEPVPLRAVRESRPGGRERVSQPSRRQAGPGRPAAAPRSAHSSALPATSSAKRARTIRRRRDVMFTLLMSMGTTFVLAMVVSSSALWMLHLLMDGLFLGFVAMLVRMRSVAAEKEMKLRILPQPAGRPQPAPVLALRRSATN